MKLNISSASPFPTMCICWAPKPGSLGCFEGLFLMGSFTKLRFSFSVGVIVFGGKGVTRIASEDPCLDNVVFSSLPTKLEVGSWSLECEWTKGLSFGDESYDVSLGLKGLA